MVAIMLAMLVPLTADTAEAATAEIPIAANGIWTFISESTNYATVHDATSADSFEQGGINEFVHHSKKTSYPYSYIIYRTVIRIPTASIPDRLTSMALSVYGNGHAASFGADYLVVQRPVVPAAVSGAVDASFYNQALWTGNLGSAAFTALSPSGYHSLALNADGLAYIEQQKAAGAEHITLILRSQRDIDRTTPSKNGWDCLNIYLPGSSYPPKFVVDGYNDLEFTSKPSVANIIKTVDGRTVTASTVAENYTSIVWDMGDGTTYSGVTEVRHEYADNGTYTVTVTAYDWLGQEASTSTAVQIGDTIPVMSINGAGMAVIAAAGSFVLALGAIARRPVMLIIGIALLVVAALLALGVLV